MQTIKLLIPPSVIASENSITFLSPCGDVTLPCTVNATPYYHSVTFDETDLPSDYTAIIYGDLSYLVQHDVEPGEIQEPIPFNPHLIEPKW